MFLGQYAHSFDEKGRLTIPVKYRDLLIGSAYLTQGFDRNLMVWTSASFKVVYDQINDLSITDPDARLLKRLIFSNAVQVELDKLGRILVPQYLRDMVDLQSSALVVGNGDYFEIWADQNWQNQQNQMQDSDSIANRFTGLSLRTK
ncbi:MAG: division/cell wall cluster transcriptional repressor MraZ [Anaerolinea sp.]|nr:division/cell wall cluster transcriptional repressor MraZ [Anaerolinea sp.]